MLKKSGEPSREQNPESQPDYFGLQEKREEIMRALEDAKGLSADERRNLVTLVMENSVKDGMEAASRLGVPAETLRSIFISSNVLRKHWKLAGKITTEVISQGGYIERQNHGKYLDDIEESFEKTSTTKPKKYTFTAPLAKKLAEQINAYYLPFIAQHKLEPIKKPAEPATKSSAEQLAEQNFDKLRRGYDRSIYGSFPRQIVAEKLRKEKLPRDSRVTFSKDEEKKLKKLLAPKELDALMFGNLLTEEQALSIFDKLNIHIDDPVFKRRLKANRYAVADVTYEVSKTTAEKGLKDEIFASLAKRGIPKEQVSIEWNEQKEEWEVKGVKGEGYKGERNKGEKGKGESEKGGEILNLAEFKKEETEVRGGVERAIKLKNSVAFTESGSRSVVSSNGVVKWKRSKIDSPDAPDQIVAMGDEVILVVNANDARKVYKGLHLIADLTKDYQKIEKPVVLGGELYFRAQDNRGTWSLFNEKGERMLSDASQIEDPQIVNGRKVVVGRWADTFTIHEIPINWSVDPSSEFELKPGYEVVNVRGGIAIYRGQEVGQISKTLEIIYPEERKGEVPVKDIAYNDFTITEKGNAFVKISINGQILHYPDGSVSDSFYTIREFVEIDQKIYATVETEMGVSILYPDKHLGVIFKEVQPPVKYNGRLYLAAKLDYGKWYVLADDETTKLSEPFDSIEVFENSDGYFVISGMREGKLVTYSHPEGKGESYKDEGERGKVKGERETKGEFEWDWGKFKKEEIGDVKHFKGGSGFVQMGYTVSFAYQGRGGNYAVDLPDGTPIFNSGKTNIVTDGKKVCFGFTRGTLAQNFFFDGEGVIELPRVIEQMEPVVTSKGIVRIEKYDDGKWHVKYPNRDKPSAGYDSISAVTEVNGEIVFIGWGERGHSLVHENGIKNSILLGRYNETDVASIGDGILRKAYRQTEEIGWIGATEYKDIDGERAMDERFVKVEKPVAIEGGFAFVGRDKENHQYVVKKLHRKEPVVSERFNWVGVLVPAGDSVTFFASHEIHGLLLVLPNGDQHTAGNFAPLPPVFVENRVFYVGLLESNLYGLLDETGQPIPNSPKFETIRLFSANHGYIVVCGIDENNKLVNYSVKISELKKKEVQGATAARRGPAEAGKGEKEEIELTPEEERKRVILNALHHPTEERVRAQTVAPQEKKTFMTQVKEMFQRSPSAASNISADISAHPENYLESITAQADDLSPVAIQSVVEQLFPEIPVNRAREEAKRARENPFGRGWVGETRESRPNVATYLSARESFESGDGDPLEKDEDCEVVLELREPAPRFITTRVAGKYDRQTGQWSASQMRFVGEPSALVKEHTWTLPNISGLSEVALPKMMNAKVLPERIKGISATGQEIPLEAKFNSWGQAVVTIPKNKGIEKIVYSQSVGELTDPLGDVDDKQFNRFMRDLIKTPVGAELLEPIMELPQDIKLFLASLKDKTPKEKIMAIESFTRVVGYYDFKNKEFSAAKKGKTPTERLYLMEQRMKQLKERDPSLKAHTELRYAGVCEDFKHLTTALLRAAGIPAGSLIGFNPGANTIVRTNKAHTKSFVVWPNLKNEPTMTEVDGTPGGVTEAEKKLLAQIRLPSLKEREVIAKEKIQDVAKASEERFAEIKKMIASNDLRQIRNLSNGELEGLFNNVLRAVTEGQRQVALSLFYSLLYSPDKLNSYRSAEAGERVRQHRFLAKELANVRAQSVERTVPTAHNFMESLTDFVKRAQKMEPDREQLYADLHSVLDLVHNDLTEKEQALLETAFTYLEAKQMKKGEKE